MKEKYPELSFYEHSLYILAEGLKNDRLINEALNQGLHLRNIKFVSETEIKFNLAARDLNKLKKIAGAKYRITILSERGIGKNIRNLKTQPLKFIGVLIIAAIVFWQSLFVESIDIDGYKAIPEQQLRACLENSGIFTGAYRPRINWKKAEKNIYSLFPQITRVHLVYEARAVFLEITEGARDMMTEDTYNLKPKENTYTDIIASKSGYIEDIQTFWGEALLSEGDYVRKGQIVVTGCVPTEPTTFEEDWPTEYFVRAKAQVWAKVPYRLKFRVERYVNSEPGDEYNKENIVSNKREMSKKEAEAAADTQIRLWAKENLPENAQILNKSLKFSYKENIIEISVTIEAYEEIGEEKINIIGEKN